MTTAQTRLALASVAGVLALSLGACANYSSSTVTDTGTVQLVTPGQLTVCTHLAYKPFEFNDETGAIVGFDVDLMDLVAEDLGVRQQIVDIDFASINSGAVFVGKRCDVGAAGISITEARKQSSLFSDGYFDATQALLVRADSGITGVEDLRGKVLAAQTDTTGLNWANENVEKYGYEIRVFDDMPTGSNAVLGGTVAASVNDNGVLYSYAQDNPDTIVVQEFMTGEEYGFNVGLDNTALQAEINKVLAAARADGRYNEIYRKWFGKDAPTP